MQSYLMRLLTCKKLKYRSKVKEMAKGFNLIPCRDSTVEIRREMWVFDYQKAKVEVEE